MHPRCHAVGLAFALAFLPLLGGCGEPADNLPREAVSGKVTLDGQPLEKGSIQFQPAATGPGMSAGGAIENGAFDIPKNQGPVPGSYKVSIMDEASEAVNPNEPPGPRAKVKAPLVPLKYNIQTTLTAEVKAGGPNEYTFDLKKK